MVTSEILITVPQIGKHLTGEILEGIVKLDLDKNTVYKSITLTLVEKVCSRYEYGNKTFDDNSTIQIKANDINQYQTRKVEKIHLIKGNEKKLLTAGSHEYLFEIKIPENTPPSVRITDKKITVGGIRYFLILKFKKSAIFEENDYFVTHLTIYPKINSTLLEKPLIASFGKTLTKLFASKKHEIEVKAELDKNYLTPCCERKITFIVNNKSDVIITIKTELICKTSTTEDLGKPLQKTKVLAAVETPSIPDNSISNMFNIIPVGPDIYTVRHSKEISREYIIRVTMKLPSPHTNTSMDLPVLAGIKP
ncbi:hypothetical protein PYW08_001966 [Mythimna loreyi]|uniref:Uncharacterized protein n=1 Tax=Mythimna loreyi TaxID=667449 RepID=A0ACC2R0Z7_9NEOP|nr:hypothetical protein PYW08_001966 [Mythimna loreyi]